MNEPSAPGPAPDPNPSATSPTELPVEPTDARGGEVVEPTTRRRLERAPADRLAGADPSSTDASGAAAVAGAGSAGRAVAMGAVGAVIGVTVYLILAIGFSFTAGLLVRGHLHGPVHRALRPGRRRSQPVVGGSGRSRPSRSSSLRRPSRS